MPDFVEAGHRTLVLRLAIYARVSTDEQREGQTIDSQIAELERFSREKSWPVVGIYKDEGWSGAVVDRPELDRLRDDAQKDLFDAVLINDVDRLARDVAHLAVIKRDLERKGIRVVFRKIPTDTSPISNLMVNILGSFAEFERELISDRTRRGRRHKVEVRKEYLGSNSSYGFRYVLINRVSGQAGRLEIVPEEAAVVRRMFEWVDEEGLSARRVMLRLNQLRIPPRKGARLWGKSSVLRVLHNETYAGVWHYNKSQGYEPEHSATTTRYRKHTKCLRRSRPRSEWLPLELPEGQRLVPRERWERVQQQLARNVAFSPRNGKHAYLLKGLVRCGACGARFVGDPCHGRFYYRCIARCKKVPSITERILNEAVQFAVRRMILNPAVLLEPLRELNAAEAHAQSERQQEAKHSERETAKLDTEEQRLLDAYRTGVISPAHLGEQLEKIKGRRAALALQRGEVAGEETVDWRQARAATEDFCAEAARNLDAFTDDHWREFLRKVIQTIVFQGDCVHIVCRIPVPGGTELKLEAAVSR